MTEPARRHIAIVGCGAMGALFGALLARVGHAVWTLDSRPECVSAVAAHGIVVEGAGGSFRVAANATTDPAEVSAPDFIFIFVKAYDTAAAAEAAAAFAGPETPVVTLQNGLGNVETLAARFGTERVIGGTTAHGATEVAPGRVRHAGIGPTIIGESPGARSARLEALAEVLRGAGIETETTADLDSAIWSKVVVNCGINAVGALTRLPNGALADDPGAAQVLRAAVEEAAAVAAAGGVTLAHDDPAAHTREVCRATAENLNSMLQDVLRRRRTEVDAINGAVARAGAAVGVATPVNAALAALVGAVERTYDRHITGFSGGSE
ncbi:MAG: 2-dehydropantoate 2-reductase [Armatimonadota bacterium]|nr:MAG: 2-dehydropantoate 2-reductase [Armatimonadota bacterium]